MCTFKTRRILQEVGRNMILLQIVADVRQPERSPTCCCKAPLEPVGDIPKVDSSTNLLGAEPNIPIDDFKLFKIALKAARDCLGTV